MKTNLLLPIAGNGQRFIDAGYTVPKPIIEINGKTILDRSLESVKLDNCNLIFIIREDHVKEHNLNLVLRSAGISPHNAPPIAPAKIIRGRSQKAFVS